MVQATTRPLILQKGSSINIYTWNPNVPYLIGKDLLLEAKQRTNGFQVDIENIENRTPRVETVKVISDIISDIIQIIMHPGRLTWNTPMEGWQIGFLSKWVICRFHVNLPGCAIIQFLSISSSKKLPDLDLEKISYTPT